MQRVGHRYRDAASETTLDVWFAQDNPASLSATAEPLQRSCLARRSGLITSDFVEVQIDLQAPPQSVEDAYLRLHLLSECQVRPNQLNLENLFGCLTNVAWTSAGPVLPEHVGRLRHLAAAEDHHLTVYSVDKFPRMVDYIVPSGVRIADADRVRLGAHLASGTTVMHEGFVNFNAGSLGPVMIEGRVTPGVIVDRDSDVGAGSSIMGTLSGGGKQTNAIGQRTLLGANAGTGISLGDDCIVEAGLYLTAGTKVRLPDDSVVQARELSGQNGLLFRRNSQTGKVEAVSATGTSWGGLNSALHNQD